MFTFVVLLSVAVPKRHCSRRAYTSGHMARRRPSVPHDRGVMGVIPLDDPDAPHLWVRNLWTTCAAHPFVGERHRYDDAVVVDYKVSDGIRCVRQCRSSL